MPFSNPTQPNLADFVIFLAESVQIPGNALPSGSPWPQYALDHAVALVINPSFASAAMYTMTCYNCATHLLFSFAPDIAGSSYFATRRAKGPDGFNLNAPPSGFVVSASDEGTSSSVVAPEWAANMTIEQMGFARTPWGRAYLSWQQSYGPTIWGLT